MRSFLAVMMCGTALCSNGALAPAFAADVSVTGAEDTGAREESDIIVSARRIEERVQDVPQTIVAIRGEDLEKLNLFTFEDISKLVAGVTLERAGAITTVRGVSFNPVAQTNPNVAFYLNEAPLQSSFVFQSMFDIGQVEVLKGPQGTLRGQSAPSGAITLSTRRPDLESFGGFAMATVTDADGRTFQGALNVPLIDGKLGIRIAGIADRTDNGGIQGVSSSADPFLKTDAVRLSVLARPVDELSVAVVYQHLQTDALGFGSALYGTGATGAAPTGTPGFNTAARQTGYALRAVQPVGYNGPAIPIGSRLTVVQNGDRAKATQQIGNAQVDYGFGAFQLSYVGGWSNNKADPATTFGDVGNMVVGDFAGRSTRSRLTRWTHEWRASTREPLLGGLLDFVVGAFHLKEDIQNFGNNGLSFQPGAFGNPLGAPQAIAPNLRFATATTFDTNSKVREWSFFGNALVHITPDTELSGGIRFINNERNAIRVNAQTAGFRAVANINANPACANAGGSLGATYAGVCDIPVPAAVTGTIIDQTKKSPVVYSATLSHRFSPQLLAYGSYGTSWRPGPTQGSLVNGTNDPLLASFQQLADEKTESFEGGVKATLLDGRLAVNLAYYRQDYTNLVFSDFSAIRYVLDNGQGVRQLAAQVPLNYNVDATIEGIDFDMRFAVTDRFNIGGTLSWSDGTYKNQTIPCNDGNFDGIADAGAFSVAQFPAGVFIAQCLASGQSSPSPRFTGTFLADASHPIGEAREVFASGTITYTGKNPYANPFFTVQDYALVNVNVGIRDVDAGWELQAFVRNLLNNDTITANNVSTAGPSDVLLGNTLQGLFGNAGYATYSMVRPRELGLTFRYAFGSR
jgi:iron complex outermembrane recepter protein